MTAKKVYYFFITILFLIQNISSIQAQNTNEKDFWLTFGSYTPLSYIALEIQIRIVSGEKETIGTIHFTNLGTSVPFNMGVNEVFTYPLTDIFQKQSVLNTTMGKSNKSIHINSNEPIKVYTLTNIARVEASRVLPVEVLDNRYYQISYALSNYVKDSYAVVAVKNNTQLYHNGGLVETLNAGEVYYRTSSTDMTGCEITANNPVAFFALNQAANIPITNTYSTSCLMEQLPPVTTWGKNFFVPVANILSYPYLSKDRVRIVASQDNTLISQTGGVFIYSSSGTYTINAGEYIELEALLSNNGCSIHADKPVGVCSYLTPIGGYPTQLSAPAQAWIPVIEQLEKNVIIAPFHNLSFIGVDQHYAIIITPFATKENTKISIGGGASVPLSGGTWYDNEAAQMSFYIMPLFNPTVSYNFTNPKGLMLMCYGISSEPGACLSYYYLAGSAMRDLETAFYANDVHFQDLKENPFCENAVTFRAEIDNLHSGTGNLKWYINGIEKTSAQDQLTWSNTFNPGEYAIRMWCRFANNDTVSKTGMLKIITCETAAAFYANNVYYANLQDTIFCANDVYFRAEVEGLHADPGRVQWYIIKDGNEYEEVTARDQLQWNKTFETGLYIIEMRVRFENNTTATISGALRMYIPWIKLQNVKH